MKIKRHVVLVERWALHRRLDMSSGAMMELAAVLKVQVLATDGDVARVFALIIHTFRSGTTSELLCCSDDCLNLTLLLRFHAFVDISGTL